MCDNQVPAFPYTMMTRTCYIPTQEQQLLDDPVYTVSKGRVFVGKGKLELSSIQWDGLTNSCVINCPSLNLRLVVAACQERELARNAFWDMPSHEGSVSCSRQIWEMKAVFVRHMKESSNWDSLVTAECDITGEKFQPWDDAAPELRHGSVSVMS